MSGEESNAMKPVFARKNIRAVFFDVQGTLIDRDRSWRKAFAEAAGEFAARWDGEEFDREKLADRFLQALRKAGGGRRGGSKRLKRIRAMNAAFAATGIPVTPSFLSSLYERTRQLVPLHPVPASGAGDALARLGSRYRLGIISNSNRVAIKKMLEQAGLDRHFAEGAVFTPSSRTRGKPNPRLFRKALGSFGVRPGEAVMVGDSWRRDVLGAVRCGMHAVHLNRSNKKTGHGTRRKSTVVRLARFDKLARSFGA